MTDWITTTIHTYNHIVLLLQRDHVGKTGEKTDCEKFLASSYLLPIPPYIFKYHLFTFITGHIDAWIPCSKLLSETSRSVFRYVFRDNKVSGLRVSHHRYLDLTSNRVSIRVGTIQTLL